ncbi:YfcC family protein [Dysosmobacter sp.]|uniref:YfcC family protein n=1 Tax=Dysosmobacter sp. TaxID=2591382 RepID=UPI002A8D0C8D|nr:YfcC family protein [Dysosmobacter sp.]MDY3282687.1 YfcC family protein [Dysosmobacter sp.]
MAGRRKFRMPTAYTILLALIAAVAIATWFIPAGSYDYAGGVPVAGTYHPVDPTPATVGDVLKASFEGFYDAVDVCLFILMVGGFLGVVMKTGAIDAGVSGAIRGLGGREKWLIPILMVFFGLGGTTYGMWEETMAFYPLLIPVFLAAGYDAVVGISVILLGAGAGVIASTVNPFATGIASGFAGVSLGEGLVLRAVMWVVFEGAAIWYVSAYAARVKRDPSASVVGVGAGKLHVNAAEPRPLTRRRKWVLAVFAAVFLVMVYGVVPFDEMGLPLPVLGWWFPELSALFLVGAIVIGLIDRMGEEELAECFVAGCADLLGVAFIIGISRGITVVMNGANVTDTILHWGEEALSGTGPVGFTLLVFLLYLPLTVLIPSSSGLATLSIPILAPLGEFSGVSGALVVTAFQTASGLVNIITPTAAVVMGALSLGHVGYDRWFRYVWKLILYFLVLTVVFLALGTVLS